jgi:hypothetical protein
MQRAFLDADGIAISTKDAFGRYADSLRRFRKSRRDFLRALPKEPLRRLRIHLDDAAIQSAFTSLILRIHLRRAGTANKPHGADVIS